MTPHGPFFFLLGGGRPPLLLLFAFISNQINDLLIHLKTIHDVHRYCRVAMISSLFQLAVSLMSSRISISYFINGIFHSESDGTGKKSFFRCPISKHNIYDQMCNLV